MNAIAPKSAMPARNPTVLATVTVRFRKRPAAGSDRRPFAPRAPSATIEINAATPPHRARFRQRDEEQRRRQKQQDAALPVDADRAAARMLRAPSDGR